MKIVTVLVAMLAIGCGIKCIKLQKQCDKQKHYIAVCDSLINEAMEDNEDFMDTTGEGDTYDMYRHLHDKNY